MEEIHILYLANNFICKKFIKGTKEVLSLFVEVCVQLALTP